MLDEAPVLSVYSQLDDTPPLYHTRDVPSSKDAGKALALLSLREDKATSIKTDRRRAEQLVWTPASAPERQQRHWASWSSARRRRGLGSHGLRSPEEGRPGSSYPRLPPWVGLAGTPSMRGAKTDDQVRGFYPCR